MTSICIHKIYISRAPHEATWEQSTIGIATCCWTVALLQAIRNKALSVLA